MMKNQQVATKEPDSRHVELPRDTCGLSAMSRSISTFGDKTSEHCDDAPVKQPDITACDSATMRMALVVAWCM